VFDFLNKPSKNNFLKIICLKNLEWKWSFSYFAASQLALFWLSSLISRQNTMCSRDSCNFKQIYFSSACSTVSVFEKWRNEMLLAVVRDVIYSPIKSGFQKNDERLRLKSTYTPEAKRRYLTPSGTRAGVFWWPLFYPLQWRPLVQVRTLLFREKVISNMNLF